MHRDEAIQIIESATRHYNYDLANDMFAIDVKMHSFMIPEDITADALQSIMESNIYMEGLWSSVKSWFEDANPDYTLYWFGRSGGWIGFEDNYDEDEEYSDVDLSNLVKAIYWLDGVRNLMFSELWEEARALQNN